MTRSLLLAAIFCAQAGAGLAQEAPLSAIDWLSESVRPAASPQPVPPARGEPPVAGQVITHEIQVLPLDAQGPRAIGTRLPSDLGLPADLWTDGDSSRSATLLRDTARAPLPALQELVRRLAIARARAPAGLSEDEFALQRIDHLLEIGALNEARGLLDAAGMTKPAFFRRFFDIALLTGLEEDACRIMSDTPQVAPTFAARIFCLARSGDWSAAALTLGTARALGDLDADEEVLLSHFLDPDLYEGEPLPAPKAVPSPLEYRLREAIGEPVPTEGMPTAYRHAALRAHIGWKSQAEAAEFLARRGVLAPGRLMQIFQQGRPSASGGIWDRISAVQSLEAALESGETEAVAAALPAAWLAAQQGQIEVPLATLWGARLAALELPDTSAPLAANFVRLVQSAGQSIEDFEQMAEEGRPGQANAALRAALMAAIRAEPAEMAADPDISPHPQASTGAQLLEAVALFEAGRAGDPGALSTALALLRQHGQSELARRAAIELLLLERAS